MTNIYIEPSEETLRTVNEKFAPVSESRFQYLVEQKKMTIEDIHTLNSKLKISYDYTKVEYERIKKFREIYTSDYASDHKKYFSTVTEVMSKMRCTLSAYKKIVDGFQPKRKRGKKYKDDITTEGRTTLFAGPYSENAFGWEGYNSDSSVKELMTNLNSYLSLAQKCLDECLGVINDEKAVRSNPEIACAVYEKSFERSIKGNKRTIQFLMDSNVNVDNDIVKAMEEAEDVKQLIASLYHEITHSDFNFFCACKTISDGLKAGLTKEESKLFGRENKEKVLRIRILLDHILDLAEQRDDVIGWQGMLSGHFVMHLLYWCGWDGVENQQLLDYVTDQCIGKIRVVKIGSVMREKRMAFQLDNDVRQARQQAFDVEMDAFVDAILSQTAERSN